MSERALTEQEAGVLLGALQSCEWDDPVIRQLGKLIAEAQQVVIHQPSPLVEQSPQEIADSRTLGQ